MTYVNEPIAVVGSGCRFPGGSSNPSKLWELLQDPQDVQRKIDRFRADNFYNKDGHYHGASNVLAAYLLSEDPRLFDTQFFNIPLSEAEAIDPQQRLLVETVYESLEAAGISMGSLSGTNTAVYVGVMCDDFNQIVYGDTENVPTYAATGSARSILSNRISYFFNWHGPSMTIDTACSSSLIAVHQAVQALRSGESPVAIAAGTNLIFGPTMFVAESNLNMLSKDGRSRMWDADANGYARGEGVGSIVMKTLSSALRDGDHIECIIRETGINQDGKTPGITMPSSALQAQLIRDTYARAGLDPTKRSDRCQYFEAHGTGTPAGDPQEAGAIYTAFFGDKKVHSADSSADGNTDEEDILYVGSIKTVVGHTEGTAGIAGLMKASLAVQNKMIPPNMHFTRLNPKLEPYYNNLKVPIQLRDWPELPSGVPRRVSVNSFGFGGANAHAIIESYEPLECTPMKDTQPAMPSTPVPYTFVFSATSEKSLAAQIKTYTHFLDENPDFNLASLSWSLFRRTAFQFRVAFSATSIRSLITQLEAHLENAESKQEPIGIRINPKASQNLMGVFTGQGAQWATMGRELILTSPFAESVIDKLERSLAELPDGPDWSLKAEMLASKEDSRIAEGLISQPLCTAVQIMVVELLHQAGIHFSAVVGHSSGEIACAYVAGFLSATDAIRVAYYRGKYTPLAKGGSMIAAGTEMQDAIDLCNLPKLRGRAQLAASNSSASVTISGDSDAIDLVELVMLDEAKFARKLKVDTAYHSFHMHVCSVPYIKALENCGIQIHEPGPDSCPWYSSVTESSSPVTMSMVSALSSIYWRDNMLQPVLFSQALKTAVTNNGIPGAVIEVGPHPALKGPASLTIEEISGTPIPYFGSLTRGQNDALSIAKTLGSIWTTLVNPTMDLRGFLRAFSENLSFEVSKSLPSYAWDHDKIIWNEARTSKANRLRSNPKHELLGIRSTEEVERELRWRNYLKPKEMPWLKGHQIQGQMVFPAAGFAVMALEAARNLAPVDHVRLMELQQFSIHKALSFVDENANVETMFVLSNITKENNLVNANFVCNAVLNKDSGEFTSMASGLVVLTPGEPTHSAMPERAHWPNNFIDTDVEFFYESLAELGYGYGGMFQGITELQRTNGGAKGTLVIPQDEESAPQSWVIHPATLDVAFQAIFAAVGAPGDGRLWTLHVPTMINSIAVNPVASALSSGVETPLPFEGYLADGSDNGIAGDVDLYDEDGKYAIVQIQGLNVTPLTKPSAADDRNTFASIEWQPASPDMVRWPECTLTDNDEKLAKFAERLSLLVLREICEISENHEVEKNGTEHQRVVAEWAQHVLKEVRAGKHSTCPKAWLSDTWGLLKAPAERLAASSPIVRLCLETKDRLESFLIPDGRNEAELEPETINMVDFYASLPHHQTYIERLGELVKQISFKHRNLRILEIGAGASTETLLGVLGDNFASYTCADLDSSRYTDIRTRIPNDQAERLSFKDFDLEQDPIEQGFTSGYYDLVITSHSLHNVSELEQSLRYIRLLLRPGGYLALLEPTNTQSLAIGLSNCLRSNWFVGIEENRKYSPHASQKAWDSALRDAGFSGIDTATPEERSFMVPFSVMCSMAVDKEMDFIRDPLAFTGQKKLEPGLLIIGGQTLRTSHLVRGLRQTLSPFFDNITQIESLVDVTNDLIATQPTTINLTELDETLFKPFTETKLKAVVKLCDGLQSMLWVTVGSRGENPYMNMMTAVGRCLEGEMPHLRLQFLNFDGHDRPSVNVLAHHLLQLRATQDLSGVAKKPNEPLYTLERELTIQNGTLLIPRYQFDKTMNTRLNSERRVINHDLDQSHTTVELDASTSSYRLLERPGKTTAPENIEVVVSKSLLHAVKVEGVGCMHVILGYARSGKKFITLSKHNQSIISIPLSFVLEISEMDPVNDTTLLLHVAAEILAAGIVAGTSGSILLHEAPLVLATTIKSLAAESGRAVTLTTTDPTIKGANILHSSSTDRILSRTIPRDASVFVDFSSNTNSGLLGSRLERLLPIGCKVMKSSDIASPKGWDAGTFNAAFLDLIVQRAQKSLKQSVEDIRLLSPSALLSESLQPFDFQIVDWKAEPTVPVAIAPADESITFRDDRTYFLVGLAGELGLQTIKWMIRRGAKYLALSSRNPKVDPQWLELVQSQGAVVNLYAMDVTSRASVHEVHRKICAEMPPVAGVMNGAMILIDGLFANKTGAEFEKTLRPKVDGTIFLDELFDSPDLDFFIVFSSLASVSGNIGQTAYAAANAFMCSLAVGRRMRGLAGSAMNMPGIVGLGYLNRDPRKLDRLKKIGYANISEWEFYQFLAEAIVAGRPDSGMNPEITAGLQRSDVEGVDNPPHWFRNPRFHTLRLITSTATSTNTSTENDSSSVRSKLGEMTSETEVRDLLLDGLIHTLSVRLNMPDQHGITPDSAIVELGVDSLLAVDMRAWFTKELDLDMPVLKILGGATVRELIDDAIKRLNPELVPNITRGDNVVTDETSNSTSEKESLSDADSSETVQGHEQNVSDASIEHNQSFEDSTEELLTIAPLELPSFEDVVLLEEPERTARPSATSDASTASSRTSSSCRYDSGDSHNGSESVTSQSDMGTDFEPQVDKNVRRDEEHSESSVAKLFSHLPDYVEEPPQFVKTVKMSYGTTRFFFLMNYLEDPTTFNLLCHVKCTGRINYDDAERCVIELGNRHEVFRTAFFAHSETNEPTMGVLEETPLRLERRVSQCAADVDAEIDELLNYEFKLEQGETIRMKMISLDENTHHVLFGFHHIAMDGFSFNVLVSEINMLYDRQPLDPVSMQFSDFATRQRQQVADGSLNGEFQFWQDMYSVKLPSGEVKPDFPEPLPLFSVAQSPRKSLTNYEFEESLVVLDSRTVRQIKAQCRRHKITTFHFFLGVLRTFLFRQLDIDDLVIGIADANRVDNSLDTTIGFMLNLLPLRFRNQPGDKTAPFKETALNARDAVYKALAHSKLPFDAMLEKLNIPRSTTHSPLFQVWMDYRPFNPNYMPTMFGGEATGTPTVGRTGYDLTLDVNEMNNTDIRVSFRTQKYLYSASGTQMLFDSYMRLVKAFAANFDAPVNGVPLWDPKDVELTSKLGHGPTLQSEWPETLSHRINEVAVANPHKQAVKDGKGTVYTYQALQRRVQTISDALVNAGVKRASRVAIFQQPTADWICSLLAIWHAGGTYIPLDSRSSLPRLAAIAAVAKPHAILCHNETEAEVPHLNSSSTIINVDELGESAPTITATQAKPNVPAAILFTSGSTGTPKGVILRHTAFRNTIEGLTKQYNIRAERVLQQSAFTFDFSLDQILCGLVNAGSVYVVPKDARGDPLAIAHIIRTEEITYTRATPSEYTSWISYGAEDLMKATNWKFAWGGGELMQPSLRQSISSLGLDGLKLYNSYGPAETITCTKTEVPYTDFENDDNDTTDIPAGFPLPNYSIYIVDHNLELVPQGVSGEIVIGGPSVAAGYLNNEKLSSRKFISNPWDGTGVVYRTGDIGYLRAGDGALMFQGRVSGDTQVKIRGIRIDLADIEASILSTAEGALHSVVVSVREGDVLVAHVQFAAGQPYSSAAEEKAFLRSLRFMLPLPVYMVPALFIPLDTMPTNAHGKIDRAAVLALALPQTEHNPAATTTDLSETEKTLIKIWKEAVPEGMMDAVPIHPEQTSFFELGGNSLLLVRLQVAINKAFGIKLSLVDLFGAASLRAMARRVESAQRVEEVAGQGEN